MPYKIHCTICGRAIGQGYVVEGGLAYCCSAECLDDLREAEGLVDDDTFFADLEED